MIRDDDVSSVAMGENHTLFIVESLFGWGFGGQDGTGLFGMGESPPLGIGESGGNPPTAVHVRDGPIYEISAGDEHPLKMFTARPKSERLKHNVVQRTEPCGMGCGEHGELGEGATGMALEAVLVCPQPKDHNSRHHGNDCVRGAHANELKRAAAWGQPDWVVSHKQQQQKAS